MELKSEQSGSEGILLSGKTDNLPDVIGTLSQLDL
jgi:hypothetical protein